MIDDAEEPDLARRRADLPGDLGSSIGRTAAQRGDIDGGYRPVGRRRESSDRGALQLSHMYRTMSNAATP